VSCLPCSVRTAPGTTNILRHSQPTAVTIELDVVPDAGAGPKAVLRIENDGVHLTDAGKHAGTGLVGLRERLAGLGAELHAEALDGGGFRVLARLPLTAQSAAAVRPAEAVP
jgi:two-component system, NarL family, sensor histidine kinase DesK